MDAKEALQISNSHPSKLDEIFRCIKENALKGKTDCTLQLGWKRGARFFQDETLIKEQIELLESKGYKVSIYSTWKDEVGKINIKKTTTHTISWSN